MQQSVAMQQFVASRQSVASRVSGCPTPLAPRASSWRRFTLLVLGSLVSVVTVGCARPNGEVALTNGDVVEVVRAVKGDEVLVKKDGREARVRLLGIHAFSPVVQDELVKSLSATALAAVETASKGAKVKLVFGSPVQDGNGRYLAYLEKDGQDLNARLVEQGAAVAYTEFPFARETQYLGLEQAARAERRNLWASERAVKMVTGLRRQWRDARQASGGSAAADPLLATP